MVKPIVCSKCSRTIGEEKFWITWTTNKIECCECVDKIEHIQNYDRAMDIVK